LLVRIAGRMAGSKLSGCGCPVVEIAIGRRDTAFYAAGMAVQ